MWANVKTGVHNYLSSSGVTVAGDGRNNSPGHTARYCIYTLMEETTKMVVDIEVIDKRETGGKLVAMEKLAMSRLLQRLKGVLTISHVVVDASTSIKALVRDMKGTCIYLFSITVILLFDTTGNFAKLTLYHYHFTISSKPCRTTEARPCNAYKGSLKRLLGNQK